MGIIRRVRSQWVMERAMLGESLQSERAQRVVKLKWQWSGHIARRTVGVPRCWNGDPAPVHTASVDLQRGEQMKSNVSLGAAGNKRPRILVFGTPYKRVSSSGCLSVKVMMTMMREHFIHYIISYTNSFIIIIGVGTQKSMKRALIN
ncbi:jg15486 [Pararge aegeria aegeria]|uniref:Jg15486 protein n=1 Tax=Pararge aegeria aegeria TaxID=348720 RepID=A0A8S4RB57_9NEOP|nr:jg15486 [Pararge aegeria aegeria]